MTDPNDLYEKLRADLDAARDLIHDSTSSLKSDAAVPALPLLSLLDQLRSFQNSSTAGQSTAIRLFKHFACTGGTIMSKCLAAMPNAVLLSEMDPLSINKSAAFAPTDLIKQMRASRHALDDGLAIEVFLAGLATLHKALNHVGQRLILREHTHSQYCTAADFTARPSVEDMLRREHEVLPLISVRHPMASYLSLTKNNWVQFSPKTLHEYARRYLAFLDDNATCPIVYYEDFVDMPEAVLENMCRSLELRYEDSAPALIMAIEMSGDSGRSGDEIASRQPRAVPDEIAEEGAKSAAYGDLCRRLRYPMLPQESVGDEVADNNS